jgi:hypothetical protein
MRACESSDGASNALLMVRGYTYRAGANEFYVIIDECNLKPTSSIIVSVNAYY